MSDYKIVSNEVAQLPEETVATRSYPYTQRMLDQQHDLRKAMEDEIYDETGKSVIVPAPVVLAKALDNLHNKYFGDN